METFKSVVENIRDPSGPLGFSVDFLSNFTNDFFWFVFSAAVLSFLLPRVIEVRAYRKQRRARRMIAARIARVHDHIYGYAEYLKTRIENGQPIDPNSEPKILLGNALYHLMDVPKHFSVALRGNVADAYFEYRILTTCGSAFIATQANDYNGIFQEIFFSKIDTFLPDPVQLNNSYKRIMRHLGRDIWEVQAMQDYVKPWDKKTIKKYKIIADFFKLKRV